VDSCLGGKERPIYVNSEQSEKPANRNKLTQEAIDRAFLREQRKSKLVYKYKDTEIIVLNAKNSHRLEVELGKTPSGEQVAVTSLERTLVDITVRPAYAGGISNVLVSFNRARPRASAKKILHIQNWEFAGAPAEKSKIRVENKRLTNTYQPLTSCSTIGATIPPARFPLTVSSVKVLHALVSPFLTEPRSQRLLDLLCVYVADCGRLRISLLRDFL
jgi:hypothetical protein